MDTLDFPGEIVHLVLESESFGVTILEQADLGRLALVCRRLSAPATNALYRSIQYDLSAKDLETFDRLHRSVADNPSRAAHVREVDLSWLNDDDETRGKVFSFLMTIPFITKLSLRLHSKLPLNFSRLRSWGHNSGSPTPLLLQCSLSNLETLFIHDPQITSNELREYAILPKLKHLTVGRYNPDISKDRAIPFHHPEVVAPFQTGLESLTLQSCPSASNSFLQAMFNGASSLTMFACRFDFRDVSPKRWKIRGKSVSDGLAPVRATLMELHLVGTISRFACYHRFRTVMDLDLSQFSALRLLKIRDVLYFPRGETESLSIYQILPPSLEFLQIYSDYETCNWQQIFNDPSDFGYRWLLELAQNKAFFLPNLGHVEIDQELPKAWPMIEWDYPAQVSKSFREAEIGLKVILKDDRDLVRARRNGYAWIA